jgi:MYXO-CTERM domain-containing protein
MKMTLTLGAATAALVAGSAMADVDVIFDVTGPGGNGVSGDIELDGALTGMAIAVDFTNAGGWTWAGDLLLGITDPNGNSIEFGGYDMSFGFTSAGDFDSSWDSSTSGAYATNVSLASFGLGGSGTWTVQFVDGYSSGADTDHWVGVLGLEGVEAVPAPGALALLGLAGIAGRRRRR